MMDLSTILLFLLSTAPFKCIIIFRYFNKSGIASTLAENLFFTIFLFLPDGKPEKAKRC